MKKKMENEIETIAEMIELSGSVWRPKEITDHNVSNKNRKGCFPTCIHYVYLPVSSASTINVKSPYENFAYFCVIEIV